MKISCLLCIVCLQGVPVDGLKFQAPAGKPAATGLFTEWLTTKHVHASVDGDPDTPLYVFNVRKWSKTDKKKIQKSREKESDFRYTTGSRLFSAKQDGEPARNKESRAPVDQNAVPLYEGVKDKWINELRTRKFNGIAVVSTHSGNYPRARAKHIEAGGEKKEIGPKHFTETYVKPLLENNQHTLDTLLLFSCNSGTRTRNIVIGSSLADKVAFHVRRLLLETPGLNNGVTPQIWGSNGFLMVKSLMGGGANIRVHSRYKKTKLSKEGCAKGDQYWCDVDYGTTYPGTWTKLNSEFRTLSQNGQPAWVLGLSGATEDIEGEDAKDANEQKDYDDDEAGDADDTEAEDGEDDGEDDGETSEA